MISGSLPRVSRNLRSPLLEGRLSIMLSNDDNCDAVANQAGGSLQTAYNM
jgi:hypothetical protein